MIRKILLVLTVAVMVTAAVLTVRSRDEVARYRRLRDM